MFGYTDMNGRDAFVCVYICTHSCGMMYDLILCRHFYAYAIYIYVHEHARMYIPIHTYLCTYAERGHFTQSPFSVYATLSGDSGRIRAWAFMHSNTTHASMYLYIPSPPPPLETGASCFYPLPRQELGLHTYKYISYACTCAYTYTGG